MKTRDRRRRALRRQLRDLRNALSVNTQTEHAEAVARYVLSSGVTLCHNRFALYFANDGELDPRLLAMSLTAMGKCLAYPVIQPSGTLLFHRLTERAAFQFNRFGIPEPIGSPPVSPLSLSVLFMPLVAFDPGGNRLGMGGGYYDRTLSKQARRPLLVGLGHELQRVVALANQPWDVPLDAVVTETGWQGFTTRGKRFSR